MQEDDLLEVLIFDEIEETVGTWLRAIIQRLEKEQAAIRRGSPQAANPKRRNVERNASLPEAASEVCKTNVSDCVGPAAASSSDFGPIRFWQTRVKAALHSSP
jgi:ssDNA-binding replication factor A large subunit